MSEATLGADHAEVGRILSVLAKVHREAGDLTRARARLERALGILTKSYGADDPDVGEVRSLLAELPA